MAPPHNTEQTDSHPGAQTWQADTGTMNPAVDAQVIADAYEQDEAAAAAECGAEFRRDIESFVGREAVEAVVVPGRRELPPSLGLRYRAFVDPSGGSQDSMTLAIAHRGNGRAVLDCVREWRPPFNPSEVVAECAETLRAYRVTSVTGDRYGGEWPRERFREHRIQYEPAEKTKSETYAELLPLLNSARVELLDQPRLLSQLLALDRRTARGGKDSIDHPPGAHDDVINAAAGTLLAVAIVPPIAKGRAGTGTSLREWLCSRTRRRCGGEGAGRQVVGFGAERRGPSAHA